MYSINEEYKRVLKSDKQQYDAYIILEDGTRIDSDISGLKPIYNLGEKIIGNFVTKRVEFTLFNTSKYNITNQEFEVFVGIKINNEFNYINLGKFIANKPEIKDEAQDECSIIAQNYSLKFKIQYKPILTFPCTIKEAIKAICEYLNIVYVENDFINSDYVLQEFFIDEDATFFDVIKILVEAGFANADINNANSLIVKSPRKKIDYTFSLNELFELKKEDNKLGPINSIVASRIVADDGGTTEDVFARNETNITKNGLYEYKIKQNDAIDYDRQTAVNNILKGILDFEYIPATIETVYNPSAEVGDIFEVPDVKADTSFLLYAKEISADLSTGLMTIESTEETQTETDYNSATNKDKKRKTELRVNKLEGKIEQVVQVQDEYDSKLSQVTQDVDKINQQLQNTMDFTRIQKSKGILHLNDCVNGNGYILELSIQDISYLAPSENLLPSEQLAPFGDYFTLMVDKADKNNKTNEAFEVVINLDESLNRLDDDIYDEILINRNGEIKLIRRVGKNDTGNLYKLDVELIENLGNVVLPTFESDTYIYVKENFNINFYIKWIIKSDFSDVYARKVELSSAIEQTTTSIMSEVNRKVDDDEFGTKIIQDFESVKIAWNQVSKYIKFEEGALKIYNSVNNNILLELNSEGIKIYDINGILQTAFNWIGENFYSDDGKYIGTIGIDNLADVSYKGLKFALEENGSFMTWNKRVGTGPSDYAQVLSYHNNTSILPDEEGVLLGRNLYTRNYKIYLNDEKTIWTQSFTEGKGAIATTTSFSISYPSGETTCSAIMRFSQGAIDSYSDLNMHGYSITNVANWESDGRLKKNIKETCVQALEEIMKIKHRQFDWKENGNHIKIGYVAQEMQEIDENFVDKIFPDEDEKENYILQINEKGLIPVITKAIQEQQKQIDNINNKLDFILNCLNLKNEYNNKSPEKETKKSKSMNLEFGDVNFNKKINKNESSGNIKDIISRYNKSGKVEMFERSKENGENNI